MDTFELIVRSLQGNLAPTERLRLMAWRWADPENERYYRDVERIWSLTGLADPAAPRPPPGPGPAPPGAQ